MIILVIMTILLYTGGAISIFYMAGILDEGE